MCACTPLRRADKADPATPTPALKQMWAEHQARKRGWGQDDTGFIEATS